MRGLSVNNKLVYGVGVSDKGKYLASINGKQTRAYYTWQNMLKRCYVPKHQEKHPTYIGCSVCPEWASFQNFAEWYESKYPNDGECYHLDKDLKVIGNKVYSPETCLLVSNRVNSFTVDCRSGRGKYMIGVSMRKDSGMFVAQCGNPLIKRKNEYLGQFESELQAHLAWRKRKSELAYELAMTQDNQEVADALLQWKLALDNNIIHPY